MKTRLARRQDAVDLSVGDIFQRLRSEKSHQQLGRRGFDSRHLHSLTRVCGPAPVEPCVRATGGDELLVGAGFDDPARVENENTVGVLGRRETVGDADRRASA